MSIISFTTASYLRSCLYLYIAFQFWKDSSVITEQPLLILFGKAMQLEHGVVNQFNKNIIGLFSILFGSIGLIDLIQLFHNNEIFFESIIPTRLVFAFTICIISYLSKNSIINNDLIFSFSFIEIFLNFFIYNILKQEKYEKKKKFEELIENEIDEASRSSEKFDELMLKIQQYKNI